jgi:hypothetical protein
MQGLLADRLADLELSGRCHGAVNEIRAVEAHTRFDVARWREDFDPQADGA